MLGFGKYRIYLLYIVSQKLSYHSTKTQPVEKTTTNLITAADIREALIIIMYTPIAVNKHETFKRFSF